MAKHSLSEYFSYFVHQILRISIGKEHYLRLDIDIQDIEKRLQGFDLPVKELEYADFLTGDPTEFTGPKLAFIKRRLDDPNYRCYGIIEDGKLIYSTWISLHKLGLSVDTRPIYLADDEGLLEDSYCAHSARGRGIHGKMNSYRIKKLYELGKRRVIAIVLDGNTAAFKVQQKQGFVELGTFYNGYFLGFKVNTLNKKEYDSI